MSNYDLKDTICALSTPSGIGAIGVIRLSGDKSISICNAVFKGKNLLKVDPNTLHFGRIQRDFEVLDEVVVALFKNPKSYTGEDIVEISCHGSPFIQGEVLKVLIENGARLAKEGEFTFRAFVNGKLNLSQAEAVADLIASDSKASKDLAISQLRGGYSKRLTELRSKLMDFASLLELELDFSEEDVDFADKAEFKSLLMELSTVIKNLLSSFEQGNVLKNGVPIAIIGEPNVGKSTLLNAILQEERAIVSDIPGTTRDYIEDEISIDGIMFRFIDTAGLRETLDEVEAKGIERTKEKAGSARLVLHLMDVQQFMANPKSFSVLKDDRTIVVLNKCDMLNEEEMTSLKEKHKMVHLISAKKGLWIDELMNVLLEKVNVGNSEGNGVMLSNIRHVEALKESLNSIERCLEGLNNQHSSELIALDVRQALYHVGEITGEVSNDDVLGNIFSKFCIGK